MDVRCERCQTQYEFDDSKITAAGVSVKCSVCGNVFKVKRVYEAAPAAEPVEALFPAGAPPGPSEREWKIRQPSGAVFTFKELTTLQKWIVERKVSRQDEISLTGESWKQLGTIAELASFFGIVDQADRAAAAAAQGPMFGAPPAATQPSPAGYADPQIAPTQVVPNAFHPEPPQSEPPSPRGLSAEPDADELAAVKGGKLKYAIGAIVLGALVGAGFYLQNSSDPEPAAEKASEAPAAAEGAKEPAPPTPAPAPAPAEGQKAPEPAPTEAVAKAEEAAAPKPEERPAPKPVETPAPAKPSEPAAAKPETPAPKPAAVVPPSGAPAGKSYDFYIQQADKLRSAGRVAVAMSYYEKASELQPDNVEPIAGKAYCLFDLNRHDEAIVQFQRALKIYPRYLDAIMGLAEAYKEKGQNAKAMEYYKRYLDEAPDGPEANVAKNNLERLKE